MVMSRSSCSNRWGERERVHCPKKKDASNELADLVSQRKEMETVLQENHDLEECKAKIRVTLFKTAADALYNIGMGVDADTDSAKACALEANGLCFENGTLRAELDKYREISMRRLMGKKSFPLVTHKKSAIARKVFPVLKTGTEEGKSKGTWERGQVDTSHRTCIDKREMEPSSCKNSVSACEGANRSRPTDCLRWVEGRRRRVEGKPKKRMRRTPSASVIVVTYPQGEYARGKGENQTPGYELAGLMRDVLGDGDVKVDRPVRMYDICVRGLLKEAAADAHMVLAVVAAKANCGIDVIQAGDI
ncbi:hypothetical protein KM043_006047 [Ampulex compressa]|nr:hypothetical protein KM043_006047 [Ampulex compressa]